MEEDAVDSDVARASWEEGREEDGGGGGVEAEARESCIRARVVDHEAKVRFEEPLSMSSKPKEWRKVADLG